jgi:hypothetical protein
MRIRLVMGADDLLGILADQADARVALS